MYSLIRAKAPREIFTTQLPSLAVSIAIAETWYKFHSFTLECLAFLATWFVADALLCAILRLAGVKLGRGSGG